MAGVLIDHPQRPRATHGPRAQDLRQVANPRSERLRALRPRWIGLQMVAVRLEMRPAAGGVDHDLRVATGERVDVVARQLASALAIARVRVEGAAAGLLLRRAHDVAVVFEDPNRRSLGVPERLAHHAPGEKRRVRLVALDASESASFAGWRKRRRPCEPPADDHRESREAATPREIGKAGEDRELSRVRDRVERGSPGGPGRPTGSRAQVLARAFHDPAEGHPRWTRGLASTPDKTRLEMLRGAPIRRSY